MDTLVQQCRTLRDAKKLDEAQVKFKEYNAAKREYEAFIAEHPEQKDEIEKKEEQIAPKVPVKKTLTPDEIIQVYEDYHNSDPVKSFIVIQKEIERVEEILKTEKDSSLVDYFKARIEMLEFNKESIENDVGNGLMSMEDYKNEVIAYNNFEQQNYKKAKKSGLDLDNMKIIELRLEWLKEEFSQFEEAEEEEEEEEQPEAPVVQQTQIQAAAPQEPEQKALVVNPQVVQLLEERLKEYTAGCNYCLKITKNMAQAKIFIEQSE